MGETNYKHKYYQLKRKLLIDAREHRAERTKLNKRNRELLDKVEKLEGKVARLQHDLEQERNTDYKAELQKAKASLNHYKAKAESYKHALDTVENVDPQTIWMIEDYPKLRARFKEYVERH